MLWVCVQQISALRRPSCHLKWSSKTSCTIYSFRDCPKQCNLHARPAVATACHQSNPCRVLQHAHNADSPYKAAKDHKHIFDVQVSVDLPSLVLRGGHGSPHSCNVGVVPSVVVHYDSPVGHGCCLVPIVPPTSHLSGHMVPDLSTSCSTMSVYSKYIKLKSCVFTLDI